MEPEETRTITIFKTDGRVLRASIPASAKVTFGPLAPGRNDSYSRGDTNGGLYLRVYKTQSQQLMVIPSVASFIDNSVNVEELVYDQKKGSTWVPADDQWWTQEKAKKMKDKLNPRGEQGILAMWDDGITHTITATETAMHTWAMRNDF